MKVVLLKDVPNLGKRLEIKNVSDGHALNFLIPNGLARTATPGVVKQAETEKAHDLERRKKQDALLQEKLSIIDKAHIEIETKANEKGHLFAAIHKAEILPYVLKRMDYYDLGADIIKLEKPIKEVGEHTVEVGVGEKKVKVKLLVKAI